MAQVVSYASAVRAAIGSDPRTEELLAAAQAIDAAADGQAFAEAMTRWRAARHALELGFASYVAGPLADVDALRDELVARFDDDSGLRLDLPLGPLRVAVDGPAVVAGPGPGGARAVVGPQRPSIFRASLDAGVAKGSGVLELLPDGFHGAFGIDLGAINATALASLRHTPNGDPSFLALVGVEFRPPVQLSFGFSLDRVGGLVAVNRRADVEALTTLLRGGAAGDALFPVDPVRDSRRLLVTLDHLFPPADGSAVVGPTLRLSWLSIGGAALFSLDLGVFVELPGPRIVLVGVARAGIQGVLGLRLDVLGVIDVPGRLASVDATLVDSGVLGIFVVSGDAAFRLHWGDPSYMVLSIGGFYPGFRPEPARVPPLARVAMALSASVPGITLRAEGYLAVTSNTIQLGGRWEAGLSAGPVSASGFLALDALVQFTPFHIHAEVSAGFRVRAFGATFAEVRLDGTVDAPGPVVISGRLTIETFLFDVSWSERFTIGTSDPPPSAPAPWLVDVVSEQVVPANLVAGGMDTDVQLAPGVSDGAAGVLVPGATLEWRQRRTPLGTPVSRVDGRPLGRLGSVTVAVAGVTTDPIREQFAPGQLTDLTAAEALSGPAFEDLPAGVRISWAGDDVGPSHTGDDGYQTFRKLPADADWSTHAGAGLSLLPASVLRMVLTSHQAEVTDHAASVRISRPVWATTREEGTYDTAYEARQAARLNGGAVVAEADFDATMDLSAVMD